MYDLSTVFGDLVVLSQPVQKTLVFAVWYAALLWLPVRGVAAALDHFRGVDDRQLRHAAVTRTGESYAIGMEVLPPM